MTTANPRNLLTGFYGDNADGAESMVLMGAGAWPARRSARSPQDCVTRLRRGAFAFTDAGTAQGAAPRQQFSVRKPISAFMPS
jgi:hypothetical protein